MSPGTFWAYHASSAPVQAIYDFYHYFQPIVEGMPKKCSLGMSQIVQYVDKMLQHGSDENIMELKDEFGLKELEHHDDFASCVALLLHNFHANLLVAPYLHPSAFGR